MFTADELVLSFLFVSKILTRTDGRSCGAGGNNG